MDVIFFLKRKFFGGWRRYHGELIGHVGDSEGGFYALEFKCLCSRVRREELAGMVTWRDRSDEKVR